MGYGRRDLARIKLGICLDCQEEAAGDYRRCTRCRAMSREQLQREVNRLRRVIKRLRAHLAKSREQNKLKTRRLSYTTLKERKDLV